MTLQTNPIDNQTKLNSELKPKYDFAATDWFKQHLTKDQYRSAER
jgi:hypothetical protein